jgi:DNA-binding response OmpR family regulator
MTDQLPVFIIEDDQFLSSILKTRLERDHLPVIQVFDGEEAMRWLAANKPAVILLDLIMPKISGFEVLQTISVDPRLQKVPVLILTNLAQDEDIAKAKELGAKEYFVKVRSSVDDLATHIKAYLPPVAASAVPVPGATS